LKSIITAIGTALLVCGPIHGCSNNTPERPDVGSSAIATTASALPSASDSASAAAVVPKAPRLVVSKDGPYDVIDLHVDTPWKVHFKGRPLDLPKGEATPDMLRRGHYAAIVFPIYIPDYIHDDHPRIKDADEIYDTIDKIVAQHELFETAVAPAKKSVEVNDEHVAVFVSIEGAGAFHEDITQIDRFIERGVRLVGPVHARDNKLASSATGKKGGYGLTELGKKFCRRVYAAGALVDVSHMSDDAFADLVPIALEFKAPIVATHSNARVLAGHKRNLTDEQLATIGKTGGVAGLNLHRTFVRRGKAKMKHVVDQVMHMVEVAGIDHVAIGTDYDGGKPVGALKDAGQLQALAESLVSAGLSESDVRKIMAQNAVRILYWGMGQTD
jgi:membrane dipeptidase